MYCSCSNHNPAVQQADLKTLEWVTSSGLVEVEGEPLEATWRPNLVQKRAILDRAFYVRDAPNARLTSGDRPVQTFFKVLRESAKSAVRALFADFFRRFADVLQAFLTICSLFADFI